MPIYEYQCLGCECEFQKLILKKEEEKDLDLPEMRWSGHKTAYIKSCLSFIRRRPPVVL